MRVEVQQLMVNGTAAVSANLCNQEIAVMKGRSMVVVKL